MNLCDEDKRLFYKLWYALIYSLNGKYKIAPPFKEPLYGERVNEGPFIAIRDQLWEHPERIEEFIDGDGAGFADDEKVILASWRKFFVKDRFFVIKHLKDYSVLMSSDEEAKLYGVIGISNPFEVTLRRDYVPCLVEAVLLPFKGRIIFDSFLAPYNIVMGRGIKATVTESYNKAKATRGIIETLGNVAAKNERLTDKKISVNLATIENRRHEVNAIKSGKKIFEAGQIEFEERDGCFWFAAEDKSGRRTGCVKFTKDGFDLERAVCGCRIGLDGCLCKHIIACVLAVQGGLPDSKITLGKTATAEIVVNQTNTAKMAGSGNLEVFATPMMTALMEKAACAALGDALEAGQISVGTSITVEHNAASPLGAKISATAVISSVRGRQITFDVSASDEAGEIGKGVHIRIIVDEERFMKKAKGRLSVLA